MKKTADALLHDLVQIHEHRPLIHSITNFVSMSFTANALLALGASPIMAHARAELEEIIQHAQALVINIGTIDPAWFDNMQYAVRYAKVHQVPIVLDPVGVGATKYRSEICLKLLNIATPTVIRGNASEILSLDGSTLAYGKGVDSQHHSEAAVEAARSLSAALNCTVVVSGDTDFIISPQKSYAVQNGSALMQSVTGTGCVVTSLIAAFCSINLDSVLAASHAMAAAGIAGEIAAAHSQGPGSFQVAFLDALSRLSDSGIADALKMIML